jgi:hypothetical protein
MVLVKMLMEIDPLSMRGSLVMTMASISPSGREVSPAEQLRRSPRLLLPRFRLETAALRPESSLLIFFQVKTLHIAKDGDQRPARWPTSHRGAPWGVGRAPQACGCLVGPPLVFLRPIFFIYSKIILRKFSGLLELCRIGLSYLLLFQSRIPAAGILPLHVNLVK